MRAVVVAATLFGALALIAAVVLTRGSSLVTATSVGPEIDIGAPSLVSGSVHVPINSSGLGFAPYKAFNIHLRWDPTLFSFGSASQTGAQFASGFCPPPNTVTFDSDGGGVVVACTILSGQTPASTGGLMMTILLTPLATGCSVLHLFTFGPPDGGFSANGTFTVDTTAQDQANTYGPDGGVNQAGAACVPAGTPTNTPTFTITPTPTNTATPSNTPTLTATAVPNSPDVVVTGGSVPSSTDSGGLSSYTIVASNIGTGTASGVSLDITLPVGAVPFKNAFCKTWINPNHFICNFPNIPASNQQAMILNVQEPITLASVQATAGLHISAVNEPPANTGNNLGHVSVNVRGCPDLDGDNIVDLQDISIVAASFGTSVGQPGYNPNAELDGDTTISIADVSIAASRFLDACKGLDGDHDGLSDYDEIHVFHTCPGLDPQYQTLAQCHVGGNLANPLIADAADTDGDGLPDGVEIITYGADPLNPDTSGDGYGDGLKASLGKDPTIYCAIMRADVETTGVVTLNELSDLAGFFLVAVPPAPARYVQGPPPRANIIQLSDLSDVALVFLHYVSECP